MSTPATNREESQGSQGSQGRQGRQGRNVWYDLMTTDLEAAKTFYADVAGWKPQPWAGADPSNPYTMWLVGERPIGGLMLLPDEAKAMGAPPHWLAYTLVQDVDATAAQAQKLGGKIYRPGFDIPQVGRIAILADPQGAVFAVYKPESPMALSDEDTVGDFSWAELNTTDYQAACRFYSELFGWTARESMDMGDGEVYFMFQDRSGATKGGMSNVAKAMKLPPHWLYYITVADIDAAIARIKAAGGQVLNGPMEIPGNDKIAQCADPQGAAFAIYAEGKKAG